MDEALAAEIDQITQWARIGRVAEALARARVVATRAEHPASWRLYAHVAAATGLYGQAIAAFQNAIALEPADVDLRLELAQAAMAAGRRRVALEAVRDLVPRETVQRDMIGIVLTFCEEPARAVRSFESACAAEPNNPQFLFNLASAQRMCGKYVDVEQTLERLLAIDPGHAQAHFMRAELRRQTPARNHVAEIMQALETAHGKPADEIALCYALAKELEDLGESARSFSFLARATSLQCAHTHFSIDEEIAAMNRLAECQPADALKTDGCESSEPIFVIGLPRSGTTLIERILSSHPLIGGIGESPAFGAVVRDALEARLGRPPSISDTVELGLSLDPKTLGDAYLEETRPQTGVKPHFVDKLLTNHLNVGLIARALPNARIIFLRRDPADSCYAMFKSYLGGPYEFTANLRDVARYYGAWARLMKSAGLILLAISWPIASSRSFSIWEYQLR